MDHSRTVEEKVDPRMLELAHTVRRERKLRIDNLAHGDTIEFQTKNSVYRFTISRVVDHAVRGSLSGGSLNYTLEADFAGAFSDRKLTQIDAILLGFSVGFLFLNKSLLITSPISVVKVNDYQIMPLN